MALCVARSERGLRLPSRQVNVFLSPPNRGVPVGTWEVNWHPRGDGRCGGVGRSSYDYVRIFVDLQEQRVLEPVVEGTIHCQASP